MNDLLGKFKEELASCGWKFQSPIDKQTGVDWCAWNVDGLTGKDTLMLTPWDLSKVFPQAAAFGPSIELTLYTTIGDFSVHVLIHGCDLDSEDYSKIWEAVQLARQLSWKIPKPTPPG